MHLQQDKRREMEYSKIHTLRLMLAQEKKTRDALSASNASHKEDILKSDIKIKKLQEQLKQVCGEVSEFVNLGEDLSKNIVVEGGSIKMHRSARGV